jgi:hypothetical protein
MGVVTLEGIVEQGQIKLAGNVRLPERTKVYVVVPDMQVTPTAYVHSPRLAHPEQAVDFTLEVIESSSDASL